MTRARGAWRCLALLLGALALAGCQRDLPVADAEKAMILRAADLEAHGWEFENPAPHEKFTKTRFWDGTYQIEYEFETPEAEVEYPLYLSVIVSFKRTASDAMLTQSAERVGMRIGVRGNDMTLREIDGFHPGATFALIEFDGQPVGNFFSMRKGRKVYTLVMSGFYFDDKAAWRELVDDKLRRFAGEAPAPPVAPDVP